MARISSQGGLNKVAVFSISGTTLTEITTSAFTHITNHTIDGDPSQDFLELTIVHKDYTPDMNADFFSVYGHNYSTDIVEDVYEDSSKDRSSPAQDLAPKFAFICYSTKYPDASCEVIIGQAVLASQIQKQTGANATMEMTTKFSVIPFTDALVFTGKFDTAIVDTITKVATAGDYGEVLTMVGA